jgi:DNA-binding XRE family transcriptional regulator
MTDPAAMTQADTVTLPRAEYQDLLARLEELEDLLAADRAEADERLPHAFVERLVSGEDPPLRLWREYRGLTQSALARKAGLRQSYVSEIEAGHKPGSIAAWKALAQALAVDLDDLVE